jgi:anti-sigma-K factor RskA
MASLTKDRSAASRRRWFYRRDLRFVMAVVAMLAAYFGYGYVTSFDRVTTQLSVRLAENPSRVNIAVTTNFAPEAFHMELYQQYGSMRGTKGNTAILVRVKPSAVAHLSRRYWIKKIDLVSSDKK